MFDPPRRLALLGLAALTLGLAACGKDGDGVEQKGKGGDIKS